MRGHFESKPEAMAWRYSSFKQPTALFSFARES
jgi:hypothetical protein